MQGQLLKNGGSCYNGPDMFPERSTTVRLAEPRDRNSIVALVRYEPQVHSHLDWKPAEEWLGAQPFVLAERGKRIVGALACPPDPADAAWVRLFVGVSDVSATAMWDLLWPVARRALAA